MIFKCTAENPWAKGKPVPVQHDDAYEVGDQENGWPGGDVVTMECPHCKYRWTRELPQ